MRKRKIKRKQIPPKILAAEKDAVRRFAAENIRKSEGSRVETWRMFEAYKQWRINTNLGKTVISIDGFGRLLPKEITRKLINFCGYICHGADGWDLV